MATRPSPYTHGRSEVWDRAALAREISKVRRRLGQHLRELRKARELSQEAAAEAIGIHPKHLQRIERGVGNATVATLVAISVAYKVEIPSLFEESPRET